MFVLKKRLIGICVSMSLRLTGLAVHVVLDGFTMCVFRRHVVLEKPIVKIKGNDELEFAQRDKDLLGSWHRGWDRLDQLIDRTEVDDKPHVILGQHMFRLACGPLLSAEKSWTDRLYCALFQFLRVCKNFVIC